MGKVSTLQDRYDRGMRPDDARALLPKGAVYNMVDWIPDLGAPLRKRGGWAYASPNLSTAMSSAIETMAVCYANFSAGPQLLAWSDNGKMARVDSDSSATLIGTCQYPPQVPVILGGKLIITPHDGSTTVRYYDGTTLGTLAGSPPAGAPYVCVYKDFALLAKANKVYFSAANDAAATWDLTNRWFQFGTDVTGMAALAGSVLIFQAERTARLRGAIPPAAAGQTGDFVKDDPIFNVGCIDARSIVVYRGQAIWAAKSGIYSSNGGPIPEDLTAACGIKGIWQTSGVASFSAGAPSDSVASGNRYTIAGGIHAGRNEYHCSIMDAETTIDYFVIDLDTRTARRYSNMPASMFAGTVGAPDELYFSQRTAPRLDKLSTTYTPSLTYKNDANGNAVLPVLEFPYFRSAGKKTWRWAYLDADVRDAASDNPYLTLSMLNSPDGSYTALSPTFLETTALQRRRFAVRRASDGFGLRVAQTGASSDTRLYELGAVVHPREPSRL